MPSAVTSPSTREPVAPLELGVEVLQPSFIRQNLNRFAAEFAADTAGSLRDRFLTALNRVQPQQFQFGEGLDRPTYLFSAAEVSPAHVRDLLVLDQIPERWEYPAGERAEISARTDRAWQLLAEVDPAITAVMSAVAGAFLFARQEKYFGGSLSAHVGIIAFAPQSGWTTAEYAGHILHECVHQILFVHDMMYGMFDVHGGNLGAPESLVKSAILKRPRPYDRSFHSAFVAHAVTHFWQRLACPELIPTTASDVSATLEELGDKAHLLQPFGVRCLNDLRRRYDLRAI